MKNGIFVLADDISLNDAVIGMARLSSISIHLQNNLLESAGSRVAVVENFETINELASQVEINLQQIKQLAEHLDGMMMEVVTP